MIKRSREKADNEEQPGDSAPAVPARPESYPGSAAGAAASSGVPLADDLIRRIVVAIDEWAADNNLSSLPRKIVFEQALSIMNTLYEVNAGGEKR